MTDLFNNIKEPKQVSTPKKKRKKQKLEGLFSSSLKNTPGLLYHKLHNNPLSHQSTHADFEVFNKNGKVFFIEAKEVQLNDKGSGSFPFSRLTQRNSLLYYSKYSAYTQSYLLLMFRGNTMQNSYTYLIPIKQWVEFENNIGKKSANVVDVSTKFSKYRVSYHNNSYNLGFLYK